MEQPARSTAANSSIAVPPPIPLFALAVVLWIVSATALPAGMTAEEFKQMYEGTAVDPECPQCFFP